MKLHFTVNRYASATRREKRDGREHLVAPVVAVREQVLNGLLTTGGEITAVLDKWNGIPLVLRHPFDADGLPISAAESGVWERQGIGRLYNVAWKGKALHGEMWFDLEKAQSVGDEAVTAVTRIENGEMMEVSTAYMAEKEESAGTFNGQRYEAIVHNLKPDHLALLPDEPGACSIADGCGVPRVNAAVPVITNQQDGIMVALFVPPEARESLVPTAADLPAGSEPVDPSGLHLTLGYLGKVSETTIDRMQLMQSVAEFAIWSPVVAGEIGGIGRFSIDEGSDTHAFYASFDCGYLPEFRQQLVRFLSDASPKTRHGFTPHITLAYIPTDAPTPAFMPPRTPITFTAISVAWGGQVTHFALQGDPGDAPETAVAMLNKESLMSTPQDKVLNEDVQDEIIEEVVEEAAVTEPETVEEEETAVPEEEPEITANDEQPEMETAVEPEQEPMFPASEVQAMIEAALAPVQAALATLQANAQCQRKSVIDNILAFPGVAFTREELEQADDLFVNRLAQTLQAPDYSGQAGGRMVANEQEEWVVIADPSGWDQ